MSIIWKYLDKRSATIAAIRDYASMQFIIDHTDEKIREVRERMTSVRSPGFDGMPHAHDPKAAESKLIKEIDQIDVLKERYRQAVEYMTWFQPAWDELTEDERYVLEVFYGAPDDMMSPVYAICDKYSIERTSAYNKKNRAVDHLQVLLFGKE